MNNVKFLLILFLMTTFFSCTKILMSAYGIKEPKFLTGDDVIRKSKELGIPVEQSFMLNKDFFKAIEKKDTIRNLNKCSPMISKYQQPLQALYFDHSGRLVSFHNNCYMRGFPKLKWNSTGNFDSFIPKTTIPLTDTVMNRDLLFRYIEPLTGNYEKSEAGIIVVIFWGDFMLKQSKELLKTARANLKLDTSKKSKVFYVNTDNCFVDDKYAKQVNKIE